MKKILTLCITIIFSCTVISILEAKKGTRGRSMSTPVTSREILQATKKVEVAKTEEEKTEAAKKLIETITDPDKTSDQQELDAKIVERDKLLEKINKKEQDIHHIDYGYFGFRTTEKQQADYIKANSELTKLNADLAVIKNEIEKLERKTGKPYSIQMENAIKILAGLGITAVIVGVGIKYFTTTNSKIDGTPAPSPNEIPVPTLNWYGKLKEKLRNWAYPSEQTKHPMSWKEKFADYAKKITPKRSGSSQAPKTSTTNQPSVPQPLSKPTATPTPTTAPAQSSPPAPAPQSTTATPPQKGFFGWFTSTPASTAQPASAPIPTPAQSSPPAATPPQKGFFGWFTSTPASTAQPASAPIPTPAQSSPPAPTSQSTAATPPQKDVIDRFRDWYYSAPAPTTTPQSKPASVPVGKVPTPMSTPTTYKDTYLPIDRYFQPTPASAP